jgi:hypothetical protein
VDLPTYTNIWRIEKRLYKLYDFRLPMPLPLGQVAVFMAIAVPYVVVLAVLGVPFSHTLLWLYVLPPGVLTWFATRPVLESKRLPQLVASQVRYLGEPRTWCRMAPLAENDEIFVTARVWRRRDRIDLDARAADLAGQVVDLDGEIIEPAEQADGLAEPAIGQRGKGQQDAGQDGRRAERAAAVAAVLPGPRGASGARPRTAVPPPGLAGSSAPGRPAASVQPPVPPPASVQPPVPPPASVQPPVPPPASVQPPVPPPASVRPAAAVPAAAAPRSPVPPRARPVVTVHEDRSAERPLRMVERALSSPAERRTAGWHDRVVVVPGGHRPGQPDQLQRDRARARLAVSGSRRIVVLGCTVGAGQTVTTLRTGELLAGLRDEAVAVLDLNPGKNSLLELARAIPALAGEGPWTGQAAGTRLSAPSRLEVIAAQADEMAGLEQEGRGPTAAADVARIFELMSARYSLTLADPAAAAVPRVLSVADQLVLVAPASSEAASAIAMTLEWLEAHGHDSLADGAITVLNGVSRQTMGYVEQAEAVAVGRCRAIVRVPWDDRLKNQAARRPSGQTPAGQRQAAADPVNPAAERAYTALAGVLVASLVAAPELRRAGT